MAWSQTSDSPVRAPVWRRMVAVFIDVLFVFACLSVVGVLLSSSTGGRIRIGNTIIYSWQCSPVRTIPPQITIPFGFSPDEVNDCKRKLFGIVYDRYLAFSERRFESVRLFLVPIDGEGHPARVVYLDTIFYLLLPIYFVILEWYLGRTLGKRILDLRVRSLSGRTCSLWQVIKRSMLRVGLSYPLIFLIFGLLRMGPENIRLMQQYVLGSMVVVGFPFLAFLSNFAIASSRGKLPWHDRWARTEVLSASSEDFLEDFR